LGVKTKLIKLSLVLAFLLVFSNVSYAYQLSYDANGNLIEDRDYKYVYDASNNLREVHTSSGKLVAKYWYNSAGIRIKKELSDGTIVYYPSKNIEEIHYPNGTVVETTYYFANNERVAKKKGNETFYYHPDHLGSTNVITDENGNLVEKTKYLPFGEVRFGGSEKYGYTGQEKDAETELMYYNARYYSPSMRKFTQPDTIVQDVYDPQTINRYSYVRNNPVKLVDPSGHNYFDSSDDFFNGYV
jgi:RHS repeat-associated protein